jgi:hypothetical protein
MAGSTPAMGQTKTHRIRKPPRRAALSRRPRNESLAAVVLPRELTAILTDRMSLNNVRRQRVLRLNPDLATLATATRRDLDATTGVHLD